MKGLQAAHIMWLAAVLSGVAERERGGYHFTQSEIITAALHVQLKPPDKQNLDHFIIRLCHLEE
jgi:hypothetical protein